MKLSAVLPTYDERSNVVPLIDRMRRSLRDVTHEIVVVDDDSPDGTAAAVEAYAAGAAAVRVIRRVGRRGLRSAIQEGIDASTGEAVVWMDCDLSMPPEKIPELYRALETHDVAIGSRYTVGGRDARSDVPIHRLCSWALNAFARLLLGPGVGDYTTGFVCARRQVLRDVRLAGEYGEYCIDFLHRARKRGFRVAEIPYVNTARASGTSKTASTIFGLVRRGTVYGAVIVRLFLTYGR